MNTYTWAVVVVGWRWEQVSKDVNRRVSARERIERVCGAAVVMTLVGRCNTVY